MRSIALAGTLAAGTLVTFFGQAVFKHGSDALDHMRNSQARLGCRGETAQIIYAATTTPAEHYKADENGCLPGFTRNPQEQQQTLEAYYRSQIRLPVQPVR